MDQVSKRQPIPPQEVANLVCGVRMAVVDEERPPPTNRMF
jgi:hypothetical protein